MIIDAHAHLWLKQTGSVRGMPVRCLTGGRSLFFGEERQMMPPYMVNGENTAEMLISNMDYAGVNAAVITQEIMDGNQNGYLKQVKAKYPERFKIQSLYIPERDIETEGFDGIKISAEKLDEKDMTKHYKAFDAAQKSGLFLALDLSEGDTQVESMREMIEQYSDLKITLGHFGMVTTKGWQEQIKLARYPNVYIESGGITWLFNEEFYPYPSAIDAILEAKELCGIEKLMWGSDYPRTMVEITYKMSYNFISKSDKISESDKQKLLFENAEAFYGFENLKPIEPVKHML